MRHYNSSRGSRIMVGAAGVRRSTARQLAACHACARVKAGVFRFAYMLVIEGTADTWQVICAVVCCMMRCAASAVALIRINLVIPAGTDDAACKSAPSVCVYLLVCVGFAALLASCLCAVCCVAAFAITVCRKRIVCSEAYVGSAACRF